MRAWSSGSSNRCDPWAFGVATFSEGADLRRWGVRRPIIVFSPLSPEGLNEAAENDLIVAISDLGSLERWASLASQKPLEFHLEIDTGMGRAGFDWRETGVWADRVRALCSDRLRWTGVYTHFHGADAAERTPTATQWERFRDALGQLPLSIEDLTVHAANSAAGVALARVCGRCGATRDLPVRRPALSRGHAAFTGGGIIFMRALH